MVSLLVEILVLALVYWVLTMLPIAAIFMNIISVVFVVIILLRILQAFGIYNDKFIK